MKRFALFILTTGVVLPLMQVTAFAAMSTEQRRLFNGSISYYNAEDEGNCTVQSGSGVTGLVPYNIPAEWGVRGKLAQMLMVSVTNDSEVQGLIDNHVGGVFLHGRQFSSADAAMLNKFNTGSTVPPIIAADEEGGQVQRIRPLGSMESAATMGTWANTDITARAQKQALLLRSLGVKMGFAPVADLAGTSSVIGGLGRAFSSDPGVVAEKAGAFAAGYRQTGVLPVFKHFPGHGNANGDSHVSAVATPDLATLKAKDLKPYESLLQSGDSAVMMGHLLVPGLTTGDVPTSLSPAAYDLLRSTYAFNGLVMTDDLGSMQAIRAKYGTPQAVSLAIQAGADMALFLNEGNVKAVLDQLEADHTAGKITDARIDQSLARIGKARGAFNLGSPSVAVGAADGSTPAQGQDNRETAYNFFISKGLSPVIAAGFVGNLVQESHVNPKTVNGIGATGIAQWTEGRKANLLKKPNYQDLMVQLEFIWEELNGAEKSAYNKILATTDLQSTTYAIRKFYERPREFEAKDDVRLREATLALEQFGNGTGVLATSTGDGYCAGQTTPIGESTVYKDGMAIYSQNDPAWGNHPYGSSTIEKSGCGPTSVATVITALTGNKVSPIEVADWGTANNTYDPGHGTIWTLFTEAPKNWGLKSVQIPASQIVSTLQSGGLVIASGKGSLPFSRDGHIIAIRAVNEQGELLLANPSYPQTNEKSWPIDQITSQARGFWAVTK